MVTVDLRIVAPTSVYSLKTAPAFKYNDGVRFAALPAIMAAKKKPLVEVKLADLVRRHGAQGAVRQVRGAPRPQGRHQGQGRGRPREQLKNEAKVL